MITTCNSQQHNYSALTDLSPSHMPCCAAPCLPLTCCAMLCCTAGYYKRYDAELEQAPRTRPWSKWAGMYCVETTYHV
jgi:thiaminase